MILAIPSTSFSALRNQQPQPTPTQTQQSPQPQQPAQQIVYIPVPVNKPAQIDHDKKTDDILFGHFVTILGNFGKLFLDPENRDNAKASVSNIIDSVVAVAQELTRRGLSPDRKEKIIALLAAYMKSLHNV
jgi:hypothetical protein